MLRVIQNSGWSIRFADHSWRVTELCIDLIGGIRLASRRGIDAVGVGVGAIIRDSQGRLFLAKRGPVAKNERGLWEFPGGSVELGETLAQTLQREMREEFGIEIEVGELLDVVDHILPEEGQHWVSPTYLCRIRSGEPQIREPGKCEAIGWFAPEKVPAELTQITRHNLEHYLQRVGRPFATASQSALDTPSGLLERLVGRWELSGQMGETPLYQRVMARPVVGGEYIELSFVSTHPPAPGSPRYAALYLVAYQPEQDLFLLHLFDTFGVAHPYVYGTARREGHSLPFVFPYAEGAFTNRFTYLPEFDAWDFHQTYLEDDQLMTFATKRMIRT